jgi:hypothetical protein
MIPLPELDDEYAEMKRCCKCKKWKPKTAFWRNRRAPDGLQSRCRDCHGPAVKESTARRRAAHPPPTEKRCPACKNVKPASEFHRSRSSRDHLVVYCKACTKEKSRDAYQRDRRRFRRYDLKRYGEKAASHYDRLCALQEMRCAICGRPIPTSDNVDHSHSTKELRGLLCAQCNNGLGCFDDRSELLTRAIAYLLWWSNPLPDECFRPPNLVLRAGSRGTCDRTGIWQSVCCGSEADATKGRPFPYCPACGMTAEWTYLRQKPKDTPGTKTGTRRVRHHS